MEKSLATLSLLGTVSAQIGTDWTFPGEKVAASQICHLDYYHHDISQPTNLTGTLCSAWSDNACCTRATAGAHMYDGDYNELYSGEGLGISNCGTPSVGCQKWFILESCFYECDVNAGRYRHHEGDDACDSSNNGWQISGMPLKVTF